MNRLTVIIGALFCSCACSQEADEVDPVAIQGGTFWMGTRASAVPALKQRYAVDFPGVFENEAPRHATTISSFGIDRYEVTNARYFEFLIEVPAWRKDQLLSSLHNGRYLHDWEENRFPEGTADRPVVNVTWSAAQAYCRWRGGRLPTEAEWEFVARAGDDREFPWGDELPSPARANYSASNNGKTTDVGTFPPNDFGVYDLAGNVWEFLYDAWEPRYSDEPQTDPIVGGQLTPQQEANVNGRRAVRGASFGGSVVNVRTRWRDSHVATNAVEFVGFRCAYPRQVFLFDSS